MKSVQRHDNWKDFIWALTRVLYYFLGLPSLICLAIASIIIYSNHGTSEPGSSLGYFFLLVWAGIIIPLAYRRFTLIARRRKLNKMIALLTSEERFNPQKQHQVFNVAQGKYLGIDSKRGTILYIHMVKKGVIDVMGLTGNNWTDREVEGSAFRLYTKNPDVPVLSVNAHQIITKELFNMLGAMDHNVYSEPFPQEPWPLHVARQSKFVEFEHNVVVPQAVA